MAKITRFIPPPAPTAKPVHCAQCLHFYKNEPFPADCRECRWFPFIRGNVKDNYVFTPAWLGRAGLKKA